MVGANVYKKILANRIHFKTIQYVTDYVTLLHHFNYMTGWGLYFAHSVVCFYERGKLCE
jgi:hypothetical protein